MKFSVYLFLLLVLSPLNADTLIVGTNAQNPPFSSIADQKDHFYGFEIDIMSEICQRIKYQCRFTTVLFDNLFSELKAQTIDVAIAAIIITQEIKKDFILSIPYLESTAQFMTTGQSPINKPEDIKNKRVGIRSETHYKDLALSIYNNLVTVVEFPSIETLLEGLEDNKVDAVLISSEAATYWFANNSTLYKIIGSKIPIGEGYGIIANKDRDALMAKINQALLDMEADGTYLRFYTRYFSALS